MDSLDFTFALVSSLTPRSKCIKPPTAITENLLKSKKKPRSKNNRVISKQVDDITTEPDKENRSPKPQVMQLNEIDGLENTNKHCNNGNKRASKRSSSFEISMTNIALRKNTRGKKKIEVNVSKEKNTLLKVSDFGTSKEELELSPLQDNGQNLISSPDIINDSSESFNKSSDYKGERRSSRLVELRTGIISPPSSVDLIESPSPEKQPHRPVSDRKPVTRQSKENGVVKRVSETSLSTAYDSDSLTTTRRRGAKVILETPDSDVNTSKSTSGKRKSSFESILSSGTKKISLDSNSSLNNHLRNLKFDHENDKKQCLKLADISTSSCERTSLIPSSDSEKAPRNGDILKSKSKLSDQFKIQSSIEPNLLQDIKEVKGSKEEPLVQNNKSLKYFKTISPILQNKNSDFDILVSGDCIKSKEKLKKEISIKTKHVKDRGNPKSSKPIQEHKPTQKKSQNSQIVSSPKIGLMPPTEVIPKYEHISSWLESTQDKSVVISGESSIENPANLVGNKSRRGRKRLTLSPRIKKQKNIAQKTLDEEQKIFEELYGNDAAKRLSEDVNDDDVIIVESSRDSVEFSENALDKLWQKKATLPQTEPRKTKKSSPPVCPVPKSEKKTRRMSIYDVFSSSSSEDRFEEFLESVKRGKMKTKKRNSGRRGTKEFINDSSSESNCSLTFYQNIVSSAVKDDVKNTKIKKDSDSDIQDNNRRRLSFSSSKDGFSESGKSDTKTKAQPKKERKKRSPKAKRKKKVEEQADKKENDDLYLFNHEDNVNVFTLVTPLKIKDKKKTDEKALARLNGLSNPESPSSVSKTKTPKNTQKKEGKVNTEERLRKKYLADADFKVPNVLSQKTPLKSTKCRTPSSPALSFLSSLSENTRGLPCHPEALVYKKEFKNRREELSKKLFVLYNREVFDNKLPSDMLIQWNVRMRSTSGFCYNKRTYRNNEMFRSSRIVLSTKILDRADRLRDTLIHELCHSATWIINGISDGHGPNWKAWADKANHRFPELPVIKRCHDYAITTKYTYKCMSCGYSIGRHSKSLDIERKRCGYCYGKFQVFLTAKMATDSVTSGSDSVKTPRNPTGFALFVKDNYATVKRENNNVPHAQVMKLLSQKFAEVKISKQNAQQSAS